MKKFLLGFLLTLVLCASLIGATFILSSCEKISPEWILVSGTEPNADPNPLVYKGTVTVHGYMEMAVSYGEQKELQFHVSEADLKNFPDFNKYQDFKLFFEGKNVTENPDMLAKLQKYTDKNPATIVVGGLTYQMEGTPTLILSEIIE